MAYEPRDTDDKPLTVFVPEEVIHSIVRRVYIDSAGMLAHVADRLDMDSLNPTNPIVTRIVRRCAEQIVDRMDVIEDDLSLLNIISAVPKKGAKAN